MQLSIRRSQRDGGVFGNKVVFALDARIASDRGGASAHQALQAGQRDRLRQRGSAKARRRHARTPQRVAGLVGSPKLP